MLFYIDPGTGSMLFSIVIGLAATLYFSLRALILKIKMKLSSKDVQTNAKTIPYVIYCEGRQYYTLFHPIAREAEKRGLPLTYYTSEEDDPLLNESFSHVRTEFIGKGNRAYAKLNFLNAKVVLMTTPGLDVYQMKRSKTVGHYAHILHAASDATGYRMFGIDYYDSVLLTGHHQEKDIRFLENLRHLPPKELVVVGCPYLDVLAEEKESMTREKDHRYTVLVSPSWGPSALLARYGSRLLDPLVKTGFQIIVRPHPQSMKSEREMIEALQGRYRERENLTWDFASDNARALFEADIMISDFSGIIFDYTFLYDKPVLYASRDMDLTMYDTDDLDGESWQFIALKKFGIEVKEEDFPEIRDVIVHASDSTLLREARRGVREEAWAFPGHGAEHVVDFLIEKGGEV